MTLEWGDDGLFCLEIRREWLRYYFGICIGTAHSIQQAVEWRRFE